jgi:hypothetical protein
LVAALAAPAAAGPNEAVEIGVAVLSAPCGLGPADAIEFLVTARRMSQVRQIKLDFSWQPPDAVASVAARPEGLAADFIAPGPPQVQANRAQFGMALFGGQGLAGEGVVARLSFSLAAHVRADLPVDVLLEAVSLGPSFAERDTIRPLDGLVLGNYCGADGQPLQRGLFARPSRGRAPYSPAPSARFADASPGEILLSARLLDRGRFRAGQLVVWEIANQGPGTLYALAAQNSVSVPPGSLEHSSVLSDARGEAFLLLDAEPGSSALPTAAQLRACARLEDQDLCASAHLVWEPRPTALSSPDQALPIALRLEPNYPNPFNAGTLIPLRVPPGLEEALHVDIFDLAGQRIASLLSGPLPAGRHLLAWDGHLERRLPASSGLYFCRLRAGSRQQVRPLLLLR